MRFPNLTGPLSRLAEAFYTIQQRTETLEQDLREMRSEVSALRTEHSDLKTRVAVLEESPKTIDAQVRAEITATVAELRVKFAEAQAVARAMPTQFLPSSDDKPPTI